MSACVSSGNLNIVTLTKLFWEIAGNALSELVISKIWEGGGPIIYITCTSTND
jgi:hypothetical protein